VGGKKGGETARPRGYGLGPKEQNPRHRGAPMTRKKNGKVRGDRKKRRVKKETKLAGMQNRTNHSGEKGGKKL